MPGGTDASLGGLGGWKWPHILLAHICSSAPLWAVAISPALPGAPVSTDLWPGWSPDELSVMFVRELFLKPGFVLVSRSECTLDHAHPESPRRVLCGSRGPPEGNGTGKREEGVKVGVGFFFLLCVGLLD